jgi:hypothetical protein
VAEQARLLACVDGLEKLEYIARSYCEYDMKAVPSM